MNDINKPHLLSCVINCVVYDKEGKRHDITLDAISDVLAKDDGSFVWDLGPGGGPRLPIEAAALISEVWGAERVFIKPFDEAELLAALANPN